MCNVKIFSLFSKYIYQAFYQAIYEFKLGLCCIEPDCSRTNFFAYTWLVYQTSQKLRLKLGLFINKQTWTSFLSSQARIGHDRLGSFTTLHST